MKTNGRIDGKNVHSRRVHQVITIGKGTASFDEGFASVRGNAAKGDRDSSDNAPNFRFQCAGLATWSQITSRTSYITCNKYCIHDVTSHYVILYQIVWKNIQWLTSRHEKFQRCRKFTINFPRNASGWHRPILCVRIKAEVKLRRSRIWVKKVMAKSKKRSWNSFYQL